MGKWEGMPNGNIECPKRGVIAYLLVLGDCVDIVDAHNADCDEYEARLAELEAQCVNLQAQAAMHYKGYLASIGITPESCMLHEAEASAGLANDDVYTAASGLTPEQLRALANQTPPEATP
jgi:hypothetical protein